MGSERLAKLSPREREVLALVPILGSSKAISARLGIEPDSVDKTLKRAMAKLGVNSRHLAARMLLEGEAADALQADLSQNRESQAATIAAPLPLPPDERAAPVSAVQEERAVFQDGVGRSAPDSWLPWRVGNGGNNDLTRFTRLLWIVAIAAIVILTCAAGLSALHNLSDLTRSLGR